MSVGQDSICQPHTDRGTCGRPGSAICLCHARMYRATPPPFAMMTTTFREYDTDAGGRTKFPVVGVNVYGRYVKRSWSRPTGCWGSFKKFMGKCIAYLTDNGELWELLQDESLVRDMIRHDLQEHCDVRSRKDLASLTLDIYRRTGYDMSDHQHAHDRAYTSFIEELEAEMRVVELARNVDERRALHTDGVDTWTEPEVLNGGYGPAVEQGLIWEIPRARPAIAGDQQQAVAAVEPPSPLFGDALMQYFREPEIGVDDPWGPADLVSEPDTIGYGDALSEDWTVHPDEAQDDDTESVLYHRDHGGDHRVLTPRRAAALRRECGWTETAKKLELVENFQELPLHHTTTLIPKFVAALVHLLRAKFGRLAYTEPNRLLIEREYLRLCRESSIRHTDIVLHSNWVYNAYFVEDVLDAAATTRTRVPHWMRRAFGGPVRVPVGPPMF